ncbi:MAG TPA: Pr6Pr family membrane protein [Candidatus Limnocylindrales bacterium]|nr:Pr6Pr family membrane protein [Candidatus Limnocylindrales bacterium]
MDRRTLINTYRLGFAVLTIVAIAAQATDLHAKGLLVAQNFFSYFTIQSNLIAVAVFLIGVAWWRTAPTPVWELVRGASVVYMTVTLVVFALLLSNTDVDTALPWVNTVVHQIMPIAVIADWLIDPPRTLIPFTTSLRWLTYPLLWVAYTLVRGATSGWYPYPFLDPANGGYASVAVYIVAILVFGAALCLVVSWIGNRLGVRQAPATENASA